jgi:ribonuclease J
LEEVGANMAIVEYKEDMIIVDAGIVFPGGELYGIDYLIPDISYIRKNIRKVK